MDKTTNDETVRGRRQQSLIDRAVRAVSVPREKPADSFVLHAPLNLMARVGLLAYLEPGAYAAAEAAIDKMVGQYESSGDPVTEPAEVTIEGHADAATRLASAIAAGDLDEVDQLATRLTTEVPISGLGPLLGETVIDSLAAAGHAPIGFHLLQRVHDGRMPPALLRGTLREITRNPDWKIQWFRQDRLPEPPVSLESAIAALPFLGRPGSDFIFPLMTQVESSGVGMTLLGPAVSTGVDAAQAGRVLSRAAAWSMLYGDPAHAPYGWTHCFTMAQGAMSLANRGVAPATAVAVAATFVAGFRLAYPTPTATSISDESATDYAAIPTDRPEAAELAAFASQHDDEHLVKYTLACFHAAEDDPAWREVYLRAAAYLADWWRAHPDATFI